MKVSIRSAFSLLTLMLVSYVLNAEENRQVYSPNYFDPDCFEVDTKLIRDWDDIVNQTKGSTDVNIGEFYSGAIIGWIDVPLPQDLKDKEFLYLFVNNHEIKNVHSLRVGRRYKYSKEEKTHKVLEQYQPTASLCTSGLSQLPSFITSIHFTDKFDSEIINPSLVSSFYNVKGAIKVSSGKSSIIPENALLITGSNIVYLLVSWPSNPEGCDKTQSLYIVSDTDNAALVKNTGGGCN